MSYKIITRHKLNIAVERVNKFLNLQKKKGNKSNLYKISKKYCRLSKINIKYTNCCCKNIYFFYDDVNKHWAETDTKNIWINLYKKFSNNLLYYTILHEKLHGIVLRENKHFLTEHVEHKVMFELNKKLV